MLSKDERNVRKGKWTVEEDALLAAYIAKHGEGKWKMVRRQGGINRSAQACRLRWTAHLHSSVKKGPLTPEEELKILELQQLLGNKWSKIALQLPGRTDTGIKNYVNALLRKNARAKQKAALARERDALRSSYISQQLRLPAETQGSIRAADHDYHPAVGTFYDVAVTSNLHGAEETTMLMKDWLLVNAMKKHPLRREDLSSSTSFLPLDQPQPINSRMERMYEQGMKNYGYLCDPGNSHLGLSVTDAYVPENIQVPSMCDTSLDLSDVSPCAPLPQESSVMGQYYDPNLVQSFSPGLSAPQETSEMMQYYDENERCQLIMNLGYSNPSNSSQGDMNHLAMVPSSSRPEPENPVQTVLDYMHPENLDDIFCFSPGPSDDFPACPESLFPNPFLNYGATNTQADHSFDFYVTSQDSSWNGDFLK